MATATITFTIPATREWTVISALAQFYGSAITPLDKTNEANLLTFVHTSIANEMKSRVQQVLLQRLNQAALATVTPPTPVTLA